MMARVGARDYSCRTPAHCREEFALPCPAQPARWARALVLSVLLLSVAACNMIEGMGKDVGNAGQAIQEFAHNVKDKM